jgi:hypothetical protein
LLEKGSQTVPERLVKEFVGRYLDSAAREVPLECIFGAKDILRTRRRFEDFKDNGIYAITTLFASA